MSELPQKKIYEAPAIAHEEVVDALAVTCSSAHNDPMDTCRVSPSVCDSLFS